MYQFNQSHVEHCKAAFQHLLDSGNLKFLEKRKIQWVMANDKRLARVSEFVGLSMSQAYDSEYSEVNEGEKKTFMEIVENWINFVIENQDKIKQLVDFFSKVILPLFIVK